MLKLGGVAGLKARLGKSTSMELRNLGLAIIVPNFPSIKSYLYLSTFFMA